MPNVIPRVLLVVLVLLSQTGMGIAMGEGPPVVGKVFFYGELPVAETHVVKADEEVCGKEVSIQAIQVDEATSGLRQVVVSVKDPPVSGIEKVLPKRIMENTKCVFMPRIGAARKGEVLEIHNQDPILHNTHIKLGKKTFLNVAQVANSRPIPKTLKRKGLHVIRCDKHTFMTGAFLVFDHHFFAVTDESGGFQLPTLPPGTYTIVVWHEILGSIEQEVTVPAKGSVSMAFEFL